MSVKSVLPYTDFYKVKVGYTGYTIFLIMIQNIDYGY